MFRQVISKLSHSSRMELKCQCESCILLVKSQLLHWEVHRKNSTVFVVNVQSSLSARWANETKKAWSLFNSKWGPAYERVRSGMLSAPEVDHWIYRIRWNGFVLHQEVSFLAVVTPTEALLWTDSRYFLQAEKELPSCWQLKKLGTPGCPKVTVYFSPLYF